MVTNGVVSSDGTVLWMYPALIQTYCALNVEYFPFDEQKCEIVFISWTFTGLEVNISVSKDFRNAIYYKSENKISVADAVQAAGLAAVCHRDFRNEIYPRSDHAVRCDMKVLTMYM